MTTAWWSSMKNQEINNGADDSVCPIKQNINLKQIKL